MFRYAIQCNQCKQVGAVYAPVIGATDKARKALKDSGWLSRAELDLCPFCKRAARKFSEETKTRKDA